MQPLARCCGAFFAIAALMLAACSDTPKLAPLPAGATVLAFGDSLTRGTGAPAGRSYPAQLERLINRTVVNAGVPGEVSAEGLERLPGVLDRVEPDLLILCHGGNDILRDLNKAELRRNLQGMVDLARSRGIPVVLMAVPKRSLLLRAEPLYRELAEQNQVPLAADIVADVLGEAEFRADRIHPNGRGYATIAQRLAELLADAGAITQ